MQIILKNVRTAFLEVFTAKASEAGGDPAFSCSLLFPPDHPQVPELEKAFEEVAKSKWGAKADGILKQLKAGDKLAMHDGDAKTQYDGFEGNLYVSARSPTRPLVINRDKSVLAAQDGVVYSGCYVNAKIELWAQDNKFGKRINAQLVVVQFAKDGDAFTGARAATESDADDMSDGADADDLPV